MGVVINPQAILSSNNSLTIQFELKSCEKYLTAAWIRISAKTEILYRQNHGITADNDHLQFFLQVPKRCLQKLNDNTFSFTLPATEQIDAGCLFPLIALEECRIYSVDITPIYLTLQGQISTVNVTVPPMV